MFQPQLKDTRDASQPDSSAANEALNAREDVQRRLAAEGPQSALSPVVLAGLVRLFEFALICGVGEFVYRVYVNKDGAHGLYLATMAIVGVLSIVSFQTLQSYSLHAFRSPVSQLFRVSGGWSLVFLAIFAAMFFLKIDGALSRVWIASWFLLGLVALAIERVVLSSIMASLARSGRLQRRTVVVGGGEIGRDLIRQLADTGPGEVRLLGVFDDRDDLRAPADVEGYPKLGSVDDLIEFVRTTRVDLVIFALPVTAEQRITDMLRKISVLPIDVRLAAHAQRLRFRPRSYSYVGAVPVLDLLDKPIADWDIVIKLVFDRAIGALALLALSPVMALTAAAVRLESKGAALFKQQRYGFNNELIEIYKFRSMYLDQLDPNASRLVTRDDKRVTKVGRFIRRTSIDELPQLFNVVFKGDLSLVGPRPHAIYAKAANRQYDEAVDGYFARHRVKPGLTGWAQIHGWRGETDTEEKIQARVEHDLYYIENWSIWLDLYILAMTPISLLRGANAY